MNAYFSCISAGVLVAVFGAGSVSVANAALPLDPLIVPKFTQQLTTQPAYAHRHPKQKDRQGGKP